MDRYEAQIKQEALYVKRQAKTGGNDENTPYYRGVSTISYYLTARIAWLTRCRSLAKLSRKLVVHAVSSTQLQLPTTQV